MIKIGCIVEGAGDVGAVPMKHRISLHLQHVLTLPRRVVQILSTSATETSFASLTSYGKHRG